ncbi:MAG: hypothetical protein IKE66_08960 [Hyphomicrobium sp.]|nr:hypothetical protein [Hyphomicrobium sp.]
MTSNREPREAPAWTSDPRVRRQMTEQIKQRRAKRMRALETFELALRVPEPRARETSK